MLQRPLEARALFGGRQTSAPCSWTEGFYNVDVIRYLQAARYPFLMPAVVRGRKPDDPRGPSGTRVFAAMKRERLVRVHRDEWCEADRAGVDLRIVPQLPRAVEAARAPGAGLCLLEGPGRSVRLGAGDVPVAVRDRVELPADEPGAGADVGPAAGVTVVVT